MKIIFHDELGNDNEIFLCNGCNEAYAKPFCDTCNTCRDCCACVDWEEFWTAQEDRRDAARENG